MTQTPPSNPPTIDPALVETDENGQWVWMEHADTGSDPARTTVAAFQENWAQRGWTLTKPPAVAPGVPGVVDAGYAQVVQDEVAAANETAAPSGGDTSTSTE